MNKTIELTKDQYFQIKRMFLKSDSYSRPVLNYINYDCEEQQIVSTDCHIMRFEPMDLGVESFLIDRRYFTLTEKTYKDLYLTGGISLTIECPEDLTFPNYKMIIPIDNDFKLHEIGLGLNILKQFNNTLPKELKGHVILKFSGDIKAVSVYSNREKEVLIGIIMPMKTSNNK